MYQECRNTKKKTQKCVEWRIEREAGRKLEKPVKREIDNVCKTISRMGNETAIIFFIFFISLTQNSRIFGVLCMKPHDFNFQLK